MLGHWKKSYYKPRQHIKKQRHYLANKGPYGHHMVKAMVFPVVLYGCESWTIKNAECWRTCFWTVMGIKEEEVDKNPRNTSCFLHLVWNSSPQLYRFIIVYLLFNFIWRFHQMLLHFLLRVPWTAKRSNLPILNQPRKFIGRTDAETPILWPLDVKS